MPSTGHGHAEYDANLLAAAPAATKAQLQSGYATDLLDEKNAAPRSRRGADVEANRGYTDEGAAAGSTSTSTPPEARPIPFYRTTKGIIIMAVAAIIVLGAIIGGAVGSTRGNHKTNAVIPSSNSTSSSSSIPDPSQGGGAAPANTTGQGVGGGGTTSAPTASTITGESTITRGGVLTIVPFTSTSLFPANATTTPIGLPTVALPTFPGGNGQGTGNAAAAGVVRPSAVTTTVAPNHQNNVGQEQV